MLREKDIRRALRGYVQLEYAGQPATVILEELALCQHEARVDLAAVNGRLHGYEIKSPQDTLQRLPSQAEVYGRALDTVTIALTAEHYPHAKRILPQWWGIVEAVEHCGEPVILLRRKPRQNPGVDLNAVVQFLWRDEALSVLEEHGLDTGLRSKPRSTLWRKLVESLPADILAEAVRARIKLRGDWRSDSQRRSGDDSYRPRAKSLHSQAPLVLKRIVE